MQVSDIKLNMRIDVQLILQDQIEYLPSRIEEITSQYYAISMPMKKGTLIPLRPGQKIRIRIKHRESFFGFDTVIAGRKINPVPLLIITRPQKLIQVEQRRKDVRIPITLPIRFRLLSENNNDFRAYDASTIDISAGGALICSDTRVKVGQDLLVELLLHQKETVSSKARAVRVFEDSSQTGPRGRIAVQYQDLPEKDRDRISKFIFNKQREFIQKGLIGG